MICDRRCGINCPYFIPIDTNLITFLAKTFPSEPGPALGDGTCELDTTAKPRKNGDECEFPCSEARIDPED
jgi:hypothetical protein